MQPIESEYVIEANQSPLMTFTFADPLALELQSAGSTVSGLLPADIEISVSERDPAITVVGVDYSEGVGFGSILLSINGTAAALTSQDNSTVAITIQVKDTSSNGQTSIFTLAFKVMPEEDQATSEVQENETSETDLVGEEAPGNSTMTADEV